MKRKLLNKFWLVVLVLFLSSAMAPAQSGNEESSAAKAQALLTQAREALGGADKFKALESLSASGKLRRLVVSQSQAQMQDGEFVIELLLPDKFLKTETRGEFNGQKVTTSRGINGDQMIEPPANPAMGRTIGDPKEMARLLRAEFGRLLLAWILNASPQMKIKFQYEGEADTPEGRADVIVAKGEDNFSVKLLLDQKSHKPLKLNYRGRARRTMTMTAQGAGSGTLDINQMIKDAERLNPEQDIEILLSDYRAVDGLLLPQRLKFHAKGEDIEEWLVTEYKLNPPLKPERFKKQ